MLLNERFNQHKLNHLIMNEKTYSKMIKRDPDDKDQWSPMYVNGEWDPFVILKRYLKKSVEGVVKVSYKQKGNMGRLFAMGGMSLQSFPKCVRHTIAEEYYLDIDMKNAHPVILKHLCESRKFPTPWLSVYIDNRDAKLLEISEDTDLAKDVVLSLINGGSKAYNELKTPPEWLKAFRKETKGIHELFSTDKAYKGHLKKREKEGKTFNHEASYMNTLLCDFEHRILMDIYKQLDKPQDCVLCFDGLMVRKETEVDLKALEAGVMESLSIEIKLAIKPMKQGFTINDLEQYIQAKPLNCFPRVADAYTYQDFQNEFKDHVFQSYEEMVEVIDERYPQVIAKVLAAEGSYIKRDPEASDIVKKLGSTNFTLRWKYEGKTFKITLEQYLHSKNGFGKFVCRLDNSSPKNFNVWSGFQAKRTTRTQDSEGMTAMKDFIMKVWASDNEHHYNYIISWFAGLFTNTKYQSMNPPINKVALAMIAPQGTGKGFLVGFMNYLLGAENSYEVLGISSITQKHNTAIQNKRLVVINEMASTKDEFRSNFDKIKGYITDPRVSIEPKGINMYMIDNIGNYLIFSNHENSIIIDPSDRRYAVFPMATTHMNDAKYFQRLNDLCYNQDVADEFYTYLMDFKKVSLVEIPDTELRRNIINLSKPNPLKFIDDEDNLRQRYAGDIVGRVLTVKASVLYQCYKEWCGTNGERNTATSTQFGLSVKGLANVVKQIKRDGTYYAITMA